MNNYYNGEYFSIQKELGQFGAKVNKFLFSPYIDKDDVVVDFGCGGGYFLNEIKNECKEIFGIEINPTAREEASLMGIFIMASVSDLPNELADVVISNHALEHVLNPYVTLCALKDKVKTNGKVVFIVPHQTCKEKYVAGDWNQHLYTWNPMTLGNLFSIAGFKIDHVDVIRHRWLPYYGFWYNWLGEKTFRFLSTIWAYITGNFQVRVVATKI